MTGQAGLVPGVVKVRLLGAAEDIQAVADLLTTAGSWQLAGRRAGPRDASASAARDALRAAGHDASGALACDGWQVTGRSAPYLNRREPGARLYLTLTITNPAGGQRDG